MPYEAMLAETILMPGHRPHYRQAAAMDGWKKVLDWFERHLH